MFHFSSLPLAAGSVIEAGSYGAMLHNYRSEQFNPGGGWRLSVELVFEMIRREQFSHLPSRFNSTFVFLTLEDALAGGVNLGSPANLYEVEHVNSAAARHTAAFMLPVLYQIQRPHPIPAFIPEHIGLAQQYWQGQGEGIRELLSESSIRVVRRHDIPRGFSLSSAAAPLQMAQ